MKTDNEFSILILGPTPPPIGGVSIHVNRLLENLHYKNINHSYCKLNIKSIFSLLQAFFKYNIIIQKCL